MGAGPVKAKPSKGFSPTLPLPIRVPVVPHVSLQGQVTADDRGRPQVLGPKSIVSCTLQYNVLYNAKNLIRHRTRTGGSSLPFLMVHGIVYGMELRIDKAGRIVVPKPLRERLGFKPDTELEAIEQPAGVLLRRVEQRPYMVKVDGLWVHQGSAEPGANWERILEDMREGRIESVLKA
jgi:AbrB family looped-hinge helix DNA binding protein